jgi:hypothetical protein
VVTHIAHRETGPRIERDRKAVPLKTVAYVLPGYVGFVARIGAAAGSDSVDVHISIDGVENAVFLRKAYRSPDTFRGIEQSIFLRSGKESRRKNQQQRRKQDMRHAVHNTKVAKTLIISNKKRIFALDIPIENLWP